MEDLEAYFLYLIEAYIIRNQNIFAQHITTKLILDICMEMDRRAGLRVSNWCWEQRGVKIVGYQAVAAAEIGDKEEGGELMIRTGRE